MLEAQRLRCLRVVLDDEWRGIGLVENLDVLDEDFNLSGRKLGNRGALGPEPDRAGDRHDVFAAEVVRALMRVGTDFRIEDDLCHSESVAQVDEDDVPVVAPPMHPAVQNHDLVHIGVGQLAARVGPELHEARLRGERFRGAGFEIRVLTFDFGGPILECFGATVRDFFNPGLGLEARNSVRGT